MAIGPAGHSSNTVTVPGRGFGPARDRTHRSTGYCCTVPGRGLRTGPSGPLAIQVIQSRAAVSVLRGIGLTEALARAGRPSQELEDFKLGGPRCCCTVTVPGRGPAQDRAIGPAGHSSYTVRGHGPWRDRTQSPKHWRVRAAAVPVRKTSSWVDPAAHWQAVAPYRTATGQGHRAGGPLYSPRSRSRAAA